MAMTMLGDLSSHHFTLLISMVGTYRNLLSIETNGTIQISLQLAIDDIEAELHRRNTEIFDARVAEESCS